MCFCVRRQIDRINGTNWPDAMKPSRHPDADYHVNYMNLNPRKYGMVNKGFYSDCETFWKGHFELSLLKTRNEAN